MTSICDTCVQPGTCCKDFGMPGFENRPTRRLQKKVLRSLASALAEDGKAYRRGDGHPLEGDTHYLAGLPFKPDKRIDDNWLYSCPHLGKDGRCKDYNNRPALCVSYQPRQDQLCVMYVEKE
jgi:Fe-S-cluster containining protein